MATINEILAAKAAQEKAKDTAPDPKQVQEQVKDNQSAERLVENQVINPNSPEALVQKAEKEKAVAENPQETTNVEAQRMAESINLIDHQAATALDTSAIETGIGTTANSPFRVGTRTNDPRLVRDEDKDKMAKPNDKLSQKAKAIFRAVDIVRFFVADGGERRATDGFFYPRTDEEVKMLEHYEDQGLVERYEGSSSTSSDSDTSSSGEQARTSTALNQKEGTSNVDILDPENKTNNTEGQ